MQQQYDRLQQRRINTAQDSVVRAIDELLVTIEQEKKRLPYSQASDIDNIRSFEGVFTSIIAAMENVWTSLKAMQIQVQSLEKSVETPALTPDEQHILELLAGDEMTDLSALTTAPEAVDFVWQTIRSLWQKGRVRIGIRIVD